MNITNDFLNAIGFVVDAALKEAGKAALPAVDLIRNHISNFIDQKQAQGSSEGLGRDVGSGEPVKETTNDVIK